MRYVGGKERVGRWVKDQILPVAKGRTHYLEPFVGSGATFMRLAPEFVRRTAGDAHPDLILMWQALAAGWEPPEHVSKEDYHRLKKEPPSALRGLVGFGASFGGKWFGGYVDTCWDAHWKRDTKPYLKAARTSVLKAAPAFVGATVVHCDYREFSPDSSALVYCDPPYEGTLGYGIPGGFDSVEFWRTAERWNEAGALVIVSEAKAPAGWNILAERERKAMLRVANGGENEVRREALFWRGLAQ